MAAQRIPYVSPEDYLAAEREAEFKSEYVAGEVFAMAGASDPHNLVTYNVAGELRSRMKGGPCTGRTSDERVQAGAMYAYPDVTVVCGKPAFADEGFDTLTNPTLIVEVLSPSTEAFDRGEKWARYRSIESLMAYVLVSQHTPRVEWYVRQMDGTWSFSSADGLDAVAHLTPIGCDLPLVEVYAGVEFPAPPGPPAS